MHKLVFLLIIITTSAWSQSYADKSELDITDMAICTAAAMKSGNGIEIYKRWANALNARYKIIFPHLSDKERDIYTAERIMDKKKALNRKGYETTPTFKKFYSLNCKEYAP